jgi:putative transcriptional regulator
MSEDDFNEFNSLQGLFLLASNHLRDPNFFRTVVLMLEHSAEGAMGLVINRPSAVTIRKALSISGPMNSGDAPVFVGGPVEPNSLFILHNCTAMSGTDRETAPGIFLASSEHSFDAVVKPAESEIVPKFRLFSGYAGWGAGQLESEVARGDWLLLPADEALILEDDPYGIWEVCLRRIQRMYRFLDVEVRNPEWN